MTLSQRFLPVVLLLGVFAVGFETGERRRKRVLAGAPEAARALDTLVLRLRLGSFPLAVGLLAIRATSARETNSLASLFGYLAVASMAARTALECRAAGRLGLSPSASQQLRNTYLFDAAGLALSSGTAFLLSAMG